MIMAIARFKDLCRAGTFWAAVLGLSWVPEAGQERLEGPTAHHTVWINEVPGPKAVKNRVHWDVTVTGLPPLTGAGATLLRLKDDEIGWHVMADPEGNEFCAFVEPPASGS
jgi:Glyoxalase-like domain